MKLDIACIRDILLCLEDCLVLTDELRYKHVDLYDLCQTGNLQKYSRSQIAYTICKLDEADFINASIQYADNSINYIAVDSITFAGHQFLDTIRPESVWSKIHSISEKTELKSISAIMDIAEIILPDTIKSAIM